MALEAGGFLVGDEATVLIEMEAVPEEPHAVRPDCLTVLIRNL